MAIEKKDTMNDRLEGIGGAAQMAFQILFWYALRSRRDRWGAWDEELAMELPGDELVTQPKAGYTHAISINQPKEKVWPWIVQIGQGRGGFYSYQWLENIAGCQIYNADEILPEFQQLAVGDAISLHPASPPMPVAAYCHAEYLLLHAQTDMALQEQAAADKDASQNFLNLTWLFHVRQIAPNTTRLISRWRADFPNRFAFRLAYGPPLTGSIAHVMDIKMLKGIKLRVEHA